MARGISLRNMKNKIIIASGVIILSTLGVVLFSIYQSKQIERELGIARPEVRPAEQPEPGNKLVPARPEDYGMVVIDARASDLTQKDWDTLLSRKIAELKSKVTPEDKDKINGVIKEDPRKTEEKLKKIDAEIQKCEEKLKDDPANPEIREKRQRLMMLKSIGREFP